MANTTNHPTKGKEKRDQGVSMRLTKGEKGFIEELADLRGLTLTDYFLFLAARDYKNRERAEARKNKSSS